MAIAHYHPVSGSAGGVDRTGVSAHRDDEQTSMEHLSCNDTSDPQATRGVMAPAHISTAVASMPLVVSTSWSCVQIDRRNLKYFF